MAWVTDWRELRGQFVAFFLFIILHQLKLLYKMIFILLKYKSLCPPSLNILVVHFSYPNIEIKVIFMIGNK